MYKFVRDDNSEWFIISANKHKEWEDFIYSDEYYLGNYPEYAELIDDPSNYNFPTYVRD